MFKRSLVSLFAIFTLFVLTACGSNLDEVNGKSAYDDKATVYLTPSSNNLNQVNGKWACDGKATVALMGDSAAAKAANMDGAAEAMLANVSMSFDSANQKISGSLAGGMAFESAPFTPVADSGKTLVIKTQADTLHIEFTGYHSMTIYSEKMPTQKTAFKRTK